MVNAGSCGESLSPTSWEDLAMMKWKHYERLNNATQRQSLPTNIECHVFQLAYVSCFNVWLPYNENGPFFNKLLRTIKRWYFTRVQGTKNRGTAVINPNLKKSVFIQRKFIWWIRKKLFGISSFWRSRCFIRTSTSLNSTKRM